MPSSNIRVVKKKIGFENVPQFVKTFATQVANGDFDTHLDVLYRIIDDRVRIYQAVDKPDDPETQKKLARIHKLRAQEVEPVAGKKYGVFGESYRGVIVEFKGLSSVEYPDGTKKARVLIITSGESKLEVNTVKSMPLAALQEMIDISATPDDETVIRKI